MCLAPVTCKRSSRRLAAMPWTSPALAPQAASVFCKSCEHLPDDRRQKRNNRHVCGARCGVYLRGHAPRGGEVPRIHSANPRIFIRRTRLTITGGNCLRGTTCKSVCPL